MNSTIAKSARLRSTPFTQRIEELATAFESAAKEMTQSQEVEEKPVEKPEEKTSRRRRRGVGGELTLDD